MNHKHSKRSPATRAGWRRVRRALRGDRGSVSAELVIATPLLLLMLLAIVQFALWSHATHIAQAAASQGLAVARSQNGTAAAGTSILLDCAQARTAAGSGAREVWVKVAAEGRFVAPVTFPDPDDCLRPAAR